MRCIRLALHAVLVFLAVSCATQRAPQPASAPTPDNRHSLWKAQGPQSVVYLLGSVHVLKPENYPLPAVMNAAYADSPIVVFEADLEAMEDFKVQQQILSKAQLPEGQTLANVLSPPVYAMFSNHVYQTGLPPAVFDQFKPSLAAITLAVMEITKLGFKPEYGLDRHFFTQARKDGKQIVPLEAVDFQVGLVTDFSKEEGEMLMKNDARGSGEDPGQSPGAPRSLASWRLANTGNLVERSLAAITGDLPAVHHGPESAMGAQTGGNVEGQQECPGHCRRRSPGGE